MTGNEPIAVIGMAGRFPKADDVEQYWQNLVEGRECMTELDDEFLIGHGESTTRLRHPSYVRRRPLMPGMAEFDAAFFGVTPRDAEIRDPQHRVFLQVCYNLLENAGYDPSRHRGSVGVYAGVNKTRYDDLHLRANPALARAVGDIAIQTANHPDYLTTFVSYKLDLRGPAMTVATACSTSLVAIHLAAQALRAGECDAAIAGGVEVEWPYGVGYVYSPGGIESPDGFCRPFDANARGTVFGSGVGAVMLKRHSDAVADRDTVYALIRGSAVTNDGSDKVAFSAPSVRGQLTCIAEALASAGIPARSVSYVEAHGTATALGDPIEIEALTQAFALSGDAGDRGFCGIGSVKSNIGHLGPASGVAGFIKVVLALHREIIPPSINVTTPNPALRLDSSPFHLVTEAWPWPRDPAAPRRAGCSSFGIGGTNAHLVLEEAPAPSSRPTDGRPQLVVTSAATPTALDTLRERLARQLAWSPVELADAAFTLRVGRRQLCERDAFVASSTAEAARILAEPSAGRGAALGGPVALAFPGQGAQYPGMARGIHQALPGFREPFDRCLAGLSELLHTDLRRIWREGDGTELAETRHAQPLMFSVGYAVAVSLFDLGLAVDAVFGHSLGELTAAVVAGVFSLDDGLRVVAERSQAMNDMPRGAMLAVAADEVRVRELLTGELAVAAVNGRRQTVVSGPEAAVGSFEEALAGLGVGSRRLQTSHGYHSPMMAPAADRLRAVVAGMVLREPSVPLVSCAEAGPRGQGVTSADFWADQLVRPVRFADAVSTLIEERDGVSLIEIGPGDSLTRLLRTHPQVRRRRTVTRAALPGAEEAEEYGEYLRLVADLWRGGHDLRWESWEAAERIRVPLPGYPFEGRRYFVDPPSVARPGSSVRDEQPAGPSAVAVPVGPSPRAASSAAASPAPPAEAPPAVASSTAEAFAARSPAVPSGVVPSSVAGSSTGSGDGPGLAAVTWAPLAAPAGPVVTGWSRPALTLLPADREAAARAVTVLQRAGLRPVRLDASADGDRRAALSAAVADLARAGRLPGTIVHALLCGPASGLDADLEGGFFTLLWLIQAVQRYRAEAGLPRWELVVLTRFGADVTGDEPLRPGRAMITGLLRTLVREIDSVTVRVVDLGTRFRYDAAVAALCDPGHPIVAVRGGGRWIPAIRPLDAAPPRRGRLRRRGVYVITGGTGALGRVTARALAGTGLSPRLVLVGRSAEQATDAAALVDELAGAGAEVMLVSTDVADPAAVDALLDRVRTAYGPVNGVLHAAGVAGDGMLEVRTRDQVDGVLRAKVRGAEVLRRALAGERDLDFVVHYGSRAALTGLVGSGDYAAANAFLDALAVCEADGDRHTVSVSWPGWAGGGMAAGGGRARPGDLDARGTLAGTFECRLTGAEWYLTEHQVGGVPVMSGTTFVDLLVRAAQERGVTPAATPVTVRDLVFATPLTVPAPVDVRVEFRPAPEGHTADILARRVGADDWTRHAQAVVTTATDEPGPVNLDELYKAWDEAAELGPTRPEVFATGPRWNNVSRTRYRDGTYLLELSLGRPYRPDLDAHPVHPALLDNATSVMRRGADGAHLPFLYRTATFFRAIPAEVLVLATPVADGTGVVTGDVELYDKRGRTVGLIGGFTMREVAAESFAASIGAAATAGVSDRRPVPDGQPPARLGPDDGAELLLRVIETDVPAHVVVFPAGTDRDLPGFARFDAGGAGAPAVAGRDVPAPGGTSNDITSVPATTELPDPSPAAAPGGADPSPGSAARPGGRSSGAPEGYPSPDPSPGDRLLDRLRGLWTDVIGVPGISPEADFFELGGDSLTAVQLVARIRDTFGVEVGVGLIFEKSVLRDLGEQLADLVSR